ncbi:TonB-dependent receptor [Roseateles koreensis]|nr:TonB-dependent receptor [Roseateles koreensis]
MGISLFSKTALSIAITLLASSAALAQAAAPAAAAAEEADSGMPRAKEDSVRLGTITIVGEGGKLGAGQMLNEDAVKGRSTVTKAATEKDRSTGNPFQALALLPGINTFNHDATGLFGGGLTVRGFNSDQLGFTVNGVPVNDSGSYSVYPQEYVDQENVCTQSVTQGSPDVESPHSGATGGNISINTCDPEDKRRVRVSQTLGGLKLTRTFVRFDSGRFADDKFKLFMSYSHTQADKWKGEGSAKKDHVDAGFRWDLSPDSTILGTVLYNRAINNNFFAPTLAQLNTYGYNGDFSSTFTPGHLTGVKGTAQVETGPTPAYYKLSMNPFENVVASVSGSFKLAEDTYLKVQPYLWTGFGTGGTQQAVLSETAFLNTSTGKTGAGVDLNGDGDTLDKIIVARGSVTKTSRPGVTAEVNKTMGAHQLKFGLWYERATHRQTQPAVAVDAAGNPSDIWLQSGQITRPDGSTYEGRDWKTISTAYQAYAADSISFMGERGLFTVGLRAPHVTRDVTNYVNENFTTAYNMSKGFNELLPQAGVRFNLDKSQQLFMNVGKNFRAPPNFAFTGSNVKLDPTTGQVTLVTATKAETSVMTDVGYRLQTRALSLSATFFNADFKDRQANAYDSASQTSTYTNAGNVNTRGLEFEIGNAPIGGFTAYASATLQKSQIKNDISALGSDNQQQVIATNGKQFALTPETLFGASLQYAVGPVYARVKLKYTGKQYATLLNDEEVPAYTVGDFDAGYNFGNVGVMSNTQLRFNVSNIANTQYRNSNSGTRINAVAVGKVKADTPAYYLGAPRFVSISLSADFN